jgi:hypothetical protein
MNYTRCPFYFFSITGGCVVLKILKVEDALYCQSATGLVSYSGKFCGTTRTQDHLRDRVLLLLHNLPI